jgi:hypothetical protein
MTSDAKIGLLLGLVFIFIIAFIINGLPRFNRAADNNKLTLEMLRSRDVNPGIGELGRQVARTTTPSNRASLSYDYVDPAGSAEAEPVRVTRRHQTVRRLVMIMLIRQVRQRPNRFG